MAQVLVSNGETVWGGVFKNEDLTKVEKVPVLAISLTSERWPEYS